VDPDELTALVDAIVMTARGVVRADAVVQALDLPGVDSGAVEAALARLQASYDEDAHGIRLERVANGWRGVTLPQLDPYLRSYHGLQARQRLSQAALEVLAIVAHRQPVTLPEVNFLRGANSAAVIRTLLERKLVKVAGRKKVVGKPFLYRTTTDFLTHFGLERPEDLPEPEDVVSDEASSPLDT
jgi:segregation and condensation protein B